MKRTALVLFLLLVSLSLYGYESIRGNIKLVLDENLGTFSLYDLRNPEKPVPFIVDTDPRTSGLFIFVDDKVHRMGQGSSFRQTLETRSDGASLVWTSSALRITQDFTFTRSPGASADDGVLMKVKVDNLSNTTQEIGIRLFLDTLQGEGGGPHFTLAGGIEVSRETTLSRNFPAYWVSGDPSRGALQVMTNARGITTPSQVVFANWKRLDSSNWLYQGRDRNFNYLPYSVNDSAVSQWYDPEPVNAHLSREVIAALGLYSPTGHGVSAASAVSTATPESSPGTANNPDLFLDGLRDEIAKVNQVLLEIEAALVEEEETGGTDATELESRVEELEQRKLKYQE